MNITIDTVALGSIVLILLAQFRILMSISNILTNMDISFQRNQTIEYKIDQMTAKLNVLEVKIERAK